MGEVCFADREGDRLDAMNKQGDQMHNYYRQRAQLTELEAQILKQVSQSCVKELERLATQAKTALKDFRAQYPSPTAAPAAATAAITAQLRQLDMDQARISNQHLQDLRLKLGEASFQKLDAFVNQVIKPGIKVSTMTAIQAVSK